MNILLIDKNFRIDTRWQMFYFKKYKKLV